MKSKVIARSNLCVEVLPLGSWSVRIGNFIIFFFLFYQFSFGQYIWKDAGNPFTPDGNFPYGMGIFNGELYVGGSFAFVNGIYSMGMARSDGSSWYVMEGATGIGGSPKCFGEYNNELYVGGEFTEMDSIPNTKCIAKWNGTNWGSVTNNKAFDGAVYALKKYKDDYYIGGGFWSLTGVPKAKCIVRYDGSAFFSVQGGLNAQYPVVNTMAVYKDELYVAGIFDYANDTNLVVNNIARWDGTSWKTVGSGVNGGIGSMVVDTVTDLLYISGNFTEAGGIPVNFIASWDGNNWSPLPAPPYNSAGGRLAIYRGKLFMGSGVQAVGDTGITYWDGQGWKPVFGPCCGPILAMQVYNDELYVTGYFDKIDTMTVNYIARLWMPPVGVEEPVASTKFSHRLKIYPNPNEGFINLEIKQVENLKNPSIEVYDANGRKIYASAVKGTTIEIKSSDWPKGTYFVSLISDGKKTDAEKVVIE